MSDENSLGSDADAAPIRPGEDLPLDRLAEHLRTRLPEWREPFSIEQFPGGHSNLTYLLHLGDLELVLRRPPVGPVAPTAHDMVRECCLLELLYSVFPLAPRPYLLCREPSVIGVPFYLMERRRGLVIRRELPPELGEASGAVPHEALALRRRTSEAVVDALAALHSVDIYSHGLNTVGRPDGMLERHIRGWITRWEASKTEEIPAMDCVVHWLVERQPPRARRAAVVHNDYKLDNVMLALNGATVGGSADHRPGAAPPEAQANVVAVLDWEMATVGDPLADLGILLSYWPQADDPEPRREAISGVTALPGWFSRAEVVERYARLTGLDVSNIAFYEIYALFKIAVILQQIYYRYHAGQTKDERFADFDRRVRGLAEAARGLTSGA